MPLAPATPATPATLAPESPPAAPHAGAFAAMGPLGLLLAEMTGLALVLPGQGRARTPLEAEAAERAHDAALEADFDNMPV